MASVRYIVNDIDDLFPSDRDRPGSAVQKHNPGKFAALKLEELHLFINVPGAGSAGKAGAIPSGRVENIHDRDEESRHLIDELRKAGASFRGEVAEAGAGRQIRLQDPSGNVIELFEDESVRVDLLR